jgi:hypothetical protein
MCFNTLQSNAVKVWSRAFIRVIPAETIHGEHDNIRLLALGKERRAEGEEQEDDKHGGMEAGKHGINVEC